MVERFFNIGHSEILSAFLYAVHSNSAYRRFTICKHFDLAEFYDLQ